MAEPSNAHIRQKLRVQAEQALNEELSRRERKRLKRATRAYKRASVDLGRVDLWTWLARVMDHGSADRHVSAVESGSHIEPVPSRGSSRLPQPREPEPSATQVVEQTQQLAKYLEEGVLPELLELAPAKDRGSSDELRVALADHFWCELLAQLARAMHAKAKFVDENVRRVTGLICTARDGEHRLPVPPLLVRLAVRRTWQHLEGLLAPPLATLSGPSALLTIRLLAIAICKAPERHKTVAMYCLDPLTDKMRRLVQRHLLEALGERWLPETARLNTGEGGLTSPSDVGSG